MQQMLFGMGLIVCMLSGLIGLLRILKARYGLNPELVRKLLHMGMGITTLTFPWLFESAWPLLLPTAITVIGMLSMRWVPRLQTLGGGVIDGVGRGDSLGEIYFPIAVAVTFILADGDILLYSVPVLLLTFADALAALVGRKFGALKYRIGHSVKSVEGSATFFAVAFATTYVALFLWADINSSEQFLIAFLIAGVSMAIEAMASRGLDNLLLPLLGFVLLNVFLKMSEAGLLISLILMGGLLIVTLLFRQRYHHSEMSLH